MTHARVITLVAAVLMPILGCVDQPVRPSQAAKVELTPSGSFRLGLYHFNPVQVSTGAQTGKYEGLAIDIGRALADRLGVPFVPMPFSDLAKLKGCVTSRDCDAVVIASDAAIAKDFALTRPFVEVDNSYLVMASSPFRSASELDRPGARIAVYTGSAVHAHLKEHLQHAELRTSTRGPERLDWLRTGQVDAVADSVQTLRVLFAPQVSGARVLDGSFSKTALVLGSAPERQAGSEFLTQAIEEMKRSGVIAESIVRWSLSARVPAISK